ncbi:uncharacterized protein LOC106013712 [Aplysia californica]|uniref:Uncharacterized protein LOC106013712 n=1 Tax=Aplysia californica TaxID=6500 RepID=A0ABM1ADI6_APLCA|nr:uncharacterized protein LOC106013712 [Aplysia californica]
MPPLTAAHYVLLVFSAILFSAFLLGFVFLLHREKQKKNWEREKKFRNMLQRRRKGISGRPRRSGSSPSLQNEGVALDSYSYSYGASPRVASPATGSAILSADGFLGVDDNPSPSHNHNPFAPAPHTGQQQTTSITTMER